MVYAYAITDSPEPAVDSRAGLCDRPLEWRASDGIAAVVTCHTTGGLRPTAENVWRHEEVVEWVMRGRAVLPARFGTVFGDEEQLHATLTLNRGRLTAGLERVRGCVELGLRVLWNPPESSSSSGAVAAGNSGRAYMAARLAEERLRREQLRSAEQIADALHAPLATCAVDSTRRILPRPELPLTAAYLVRRDETDQFRRVVEGLSAAHPKLRLLCTGPWPPYHFVPSIHQPAEAARA